MNQDNGDGGENPPLRPRLVVVYVLGVGRSGSTVIERVLGGFPGFCNVGELVELFRQIAPKDERCGCGEQFSACPLWQAVGRRGFADWDPALVRQNAQLQHAVARQRYLPHVLQPRLASSAFRKRLKQYLDLQYTTYTTVAEESGADVLVDASKAIAPLLAMRLDPRIDLRVLHLVRDVRGVAHSWAKSDVRRPHATSNERGTMASFSTSRTAIRWTRMEAQAAVAGRLIRPSATVRYEDFVASPASTMLRALDDLGLGGRAASHIDGHDVMLPASHGISGNPSRFTTGTVRIRSDQSWRQALRPNQRAAVTALGLPGLLRNGYLGGRADATPPAPQR